MIPISLCGQNYFSYFTGHLNDTLTYPSGGVCMMGGATEDDNAMRWFLQRADGGDVLVLRTSGSNGYNSYMFSLGVAINSVESIVCNNISASYDPYVLRKIQQAEAIWFAGGDQWNYIRYWRNTPVDSLINLALVQKNIVIGGTSAGMAILGKYYFTAQGGTVTSASALANPYNSKVKVDSARFLSIDHLHNVITDTHFDNPDRRGRLVVFLARIYKDYGVFAKGIACDEYTAVCVDTTGLARVFGGHPAYDDNAYFIQNNCELPVQAPENCTAGNPLTWYWGGEALKVYGIKGTSNGANTFNLNDWKTGTGGTWFDWGVNNGEFSQQTGDAINCSVTAVEPDLAVDGIVLFPNPASDRIFLSSSRIDLQTSTFTVYNVTGQQQRIESFVHSGGNAEILIRNLEGGIYILNISLGKNRQTHYLFIRRD